MANSNYLPEEIFPTKDYLIFSIVIVPELKFFFLSLLLRTKIENSMESLYKEDDDSFKAHTNTTKVKEQYNELNLKRVASKEV